MTDLRSEALQGFVSSAHRELFCAASSSSLVSEPGSLHYPCPDGSSLESDGDTQLLLRGDAAARSPTIPG